MKKLITVLLLLMLMLTACGGGQTASQDASQDTSAETDSEQSAGELFSGNKSIEGEWTDGNSLITIEGDSVLVEHLGNSYVGSVDTGAKTLTVKDGQLDEYYEATGDIVFDYQMIKDKLVIDAQTKSDNNAFGWDETYSFERVPAEETESADQAA